LSYKVLKFDSPFSSLEIFPIWPTCQSVFTCRPNSWCSSRPVRFFCRPAIFFIFSPFANPRAVSGQHQSAFCSRTRCRWSESFQGLIQTRPLTPLGPPLSDVDTASVSLGSPDTGPTAPPLACLRRPVLVFLTHAFLVLHSSDDFSVPSSPPLLSGGPAVVIRISKEVLGN